MASETGSSEAPTSLLLGQEASLMHPNFEDADFERSFVMEGEDVREAVSPALRVHGESSRREGLELDRATLGRDRTSG